MPLRKDIWRPAIVAAPIGEIAARGSLDGLAIRPLPPMGSFRFLADPFGLWRDGHLHVFVETYDYRVRIGAIERLTYDSAFSLVDRGLVLEEPWHLSYPFVFEGEGETWMLPEAHRSGQLTLYRATAFPDRWEPAFPIGLGQVPVDATPVLHDGLWWLFYSSASTEADKMASLNIAFAERLQGPWRPHPMNPVRRDLSGARPGGTPFLSDGRLVLPVQDCSTTYGGAIKLLRCDMLTPDEFRADISKGITAPSTLTPFVEGLHTLAAAGPITLIDTKRTELSAHGLSIEIRREVGKLMRRGRR